MNKETKREITARLVQELAQALQDTQEDPEDYVLDRAISIAGHPNQTSIVLNIIPGSNHVLPSGPARASTFQGRPGIIAGFTLNPAALRLKMQITLDGSVAFQTQGDKFWQDEPLTPGQQEVVDRHCQATALQIDRRCTREWLDEDSDEEAKELNPEIMSLEEIREMLDETRNKESAFARGSSPVEKVVNLTDNLTPCHAMAKAILEEIEYVRGPNEDLLLEAYQLVKEWTREAGGANWTVPQILKQEGDGRDAA